MPCAALALAQWLPGPNQAGFRHPAAQRQAAPPSPISAVTESARPKVFFVPCRFSVYMLLTVDKIYTILMTSARENVMTYRAELEGFTGHFNTGIEAEKKAAERRSPAPVGSGA